MVFLMYLNNDSQHQARQVDVDVKERTPFQRKFENEMFVERWERMPTASTISCFGHVPWSGELAPRVLDVCCGTGKAAREFARYNPRCELVLVDRSAEAVTRATEAMADGGLKPSSATAVCLAAEDISEELGPFDVVLMRYGLHLIESPERVLRTLYRMLRPGGVLALNLPGSNIYRFRDQHHNALPNSDGVAHPFFVAFLQSCQQQSGSILAAVDGAMDVPEFNLASDLVTRGVGKGVAQKVIRFDRDRVFQILSQAGIPLHVVEQRIVFMKSDIQTKLAFASNSGSPPIPGLWQLFNVMEPNARAEVMERIVHGVNKIVGLEKQFRFPEPMFLAHKPPSQCAA